jgi:FAD/FMN-containing dehydrogenase
MTVTQTVSAEALRSLASALQGYVIIDGHDEYDSARRIWNGMIDRRPAVIVRCADVRDVVTAVRFAREHDLVVAVRGGGHSVAGLSTCDGGIVIDLSAMRGITVDYPRRLAKAEPGVLWGELDRAAQYFGLAASGGVVSHTGIAGLTLGGGFGWLARKYGLACDNLTSAEVVTASGNVVTASAEQNPELFWGLRGGGGNFGIVTSFEYRLHPVGPLVMAGSLYWTLDHASEVYGFYRNWTAGLSDDLATGIGIWRAPDEHFIPDDLRGVPMLSVVAVHIGPSIEEGQRLVNELRTAVPPTFDDVKTIPYVAVNHMLDVPHGVRSYWKTIHVETLNDDLLKTLSELFKRAPSPDSQLYIEHALGAVARIPDDAMAFSHRTAPFRIIVDALWSEAADDGPNIDWAHEAGAALQPFATGTSYLNYVADTSEADVRRGYTEAKYRRLLALKDEYDPGNLFSLNLNIKPSSIAEPIAREAPQ